ncbi:hypothetical protein, partial [Gluconacetobacter diazotrophicus]|uniref:hypothetical protein n=1 Tax=Gluconacetobacter diazotrophicus TaxID=33996 RepID=UPI001C819F89
PGTGRKRQPLDQPIKHSRDNQRPGQFSMKTQGQISAEFNKLGKPTTTLEMFARGMRQSRSLQQSVK